MGPVVKVAGVNEVMSAEVQIGREVKEVSMKSQSG